MQGYHGSRWELELLTSVDIMHIEGGKRGKPFVHVVIFTPKGQADRPFNLTEAEYKAVAEAIEEDIKDD